MISIDTVRDYYERGIICLPLGKKGALRKWGGMQSRVPSWDEMEQLFHGLKGYNIGALCGIPSGNLAVIDCDSDEVYQDFTRRFQEEVGDTVMVKSFRGGHIYIRTAFPVKSIARKKQGYEIKGVGNYAVLPPSLHPEKVLYRFESETKQIAHVNSLSFVELIPSKPKEQALALPVDDSNELTSDEIQGIIGLLSSHLRRENEGHYPSKSEFDFGVVSTLVNAGLGLANIQQVFLHAAIYERSSYGRRYDESGSDVAHDYLERTYRRVLENPPSAEYLSNIRFAEDALEWVANSPWPGQTGSSDRGTLEVHLETIIRSGKSPYGLAAREGALLGDKSAVGFSNSTRRLVYEHGYLTITTEDKKLSKWNSEAYKYAPSEKLIKIVSEWKDKIDTIKLKGMDNCIKLVPPRKDTCGVFQWGFLSHSGYEIFSCLWNGYKSPKEIALLTGKCVKTVNRQLKKLSMYEIVKKSGHLYTANQEFDFLKLSVALNSLEPKSRRTRIYKEEQVRQLEFTESFRDKKTMIIAAL